MELTDYYLTSFEAECEGVCVGGMFLEFREKVRLVFFVIQKKVLTVKLKMIVCLDISVLEMFSNSLFDPFEGNCQNYHWEYLIS